jgi:DNA-binding SARP family transcriptional activator
MLEFRTLGKLDLWGEDGRRIESVLLHSKRLSLLAYLCVSDPPRLHRRDTLIALFWPELDDAHARGALRQELSRLRRALGRDAILGEGSEAVGVDARRLWCDAAAFEAALRAGELSSALGLWGGEFLPGLHVDGGEFDRWLDDARDSLRRRAVDAARSLSAEAELAGDLARAVDSARRLTELAPYDESGWQRLITLLDLCGDRAGALTAYDVLTVRLKTELELDPSPETRALSERIRTRIKAFADTTAPMVPPGPLSVARPPPVLLPSGMVAVRILPVENQTGDPGHDVIAQWLKDRLDRWISELYWVHLDDDERVQARVVVSGTLRARGERVEVRTRLAEPGEGGAILAAPDPVLLRSLSDTASLDALVAHVAATLAARYHPRVAVPPAIPAPFRPPSYEAFLWYLTGSELFGEFQFAEAAANLRKAYEIDPTFVKAAQFSAISLAWGGDPAAAETLATAAMAANQPLPDYERYFGQWILASLRGRREEAYRNARETARVSSHPLLQGILAWEALRHGLAGEVVRTMRAVSDWGIGWWRNWTNMAEAYASALHVLGDHTTELSAVLSRREATSESFDLVRADSGPRGTRPAHRGAEARRGSPDNSSQPHHGTAARGYHARRHCLGGGPGTRLSRAAASSRESTCNRSRLAAEAQRSDESRAAARRTPAARDGRRRGRATGPGYAGTLRRSVVSRSRRTGCRRAGRRHDCMPGDRQPPGHEQPLPGRLPPAGGGGCAGGPEPTRFSGCHPPRRASTRPAIRRRVARPADAEAAAWLQ